MHRSIQNGGPKRLLPSLAPVFFLLAVARGESLPAADLLMERMLGRSRSLAASTNTVAWLYDKRTVVERLDGKGRVEERTEKLYRVAIIQGVPFSRLIRVEGRELTAAEIQKENEREAAFRKKISGRDPQSAVESGEAFITEDLVSRYAYEALRRETNHGRSAVVVAFSPRPGKRDEKTARDHVLNRLAGTLWIDEATADVSRLQVHLLSPFSLGVLGVLGSVKTCHFELASRPMPDGTWLPDTMVMGLSARMLFSGIHVRVIERCSNHRPETALPGTPIPQKNNDANESSR